MKRNLLFAGTFAVAALFAAGCASNALDEVLSPGVDDAGINEELFPLKLSVEGGMSRTVLSGNDVHWQKGDAATVFPGNGTKGRSFVAQSEGDKATTFLGQVSATELSATSFVFTYPQSASVTRASGTSNTLSGITIPATQTLTLNSFGRGAAVSVGQSSGSSLQFKNITGLLKISVKSDKAVTVTGISVTGPATLTGTGSVDAAAAVPMLTISGGSATVRLTGSVALEANKATDFYAAVAPVGEPGTYSILVTTSDNKTFSTSVAGAGVARAKITTLPTVNMTSAALGTTVHYGLYNCYLRTANGGFDIDITPRLYDPLTCVDKGTTTGTAVKDAIIYWKENNLTVGTPTVSGNKVNIPSLTGTGNALIAIRDASGNVLWSYHIWKPNDPVTTITYNTDKPDVKTGRKYEVLPMALGATTKLGDGSAGLYYQWGRKDPLGRVGGITSGSSWIGMTAGTGGKLPSSAAVPQSTAGTSNEAVLAYSIKNPATFIYYSNATTYDWMPTKYNALWGNEAGYTYPATTSRSVFDPCPQGYKVAPKELWRIFTKWNGNTSTAANFNVNGSFANGWNFYYDSTDKTGPTDFYPASGYRASYSGGLSIVGTDGYSWSSSPVSTSSVGGSRLGFSSGSVYPENGYYRAYGFPVRCVKE